MKKKPYELDAFLKQGNLGKTRIYLFFGPDEGRMRTLTEAVVTAAQPAEKRVLLPKAVTEGEVLLADELAAVSLFGDIQVFILQGATDGLVHAVEALEGIQANNILVLQGAESLNTKSPLVKYAEAAPHIFAAACYHEEGDNLKRTLGGLLQKEGLQPTPGALQLLTELVDSDYHVLRNEIDKLALYKGGPGPVTEEDVMATASTGVVEELDGLTAAIFQSEIRTLQSLYYRLLEARTPVVQMLRNLTNHAQRLQRLLEAQSAGQSLDIALRNARIHFRQEAAVRRQLTLWTEPALKRALAILWQAERDSRLHAAHDAPSLLFRHFADIAKLIRR